MYILVEAKVMCLNRGKESVILAVPVPVPNISHNSMFMGLIQKARYSPFAGS